MALIQFQHFGSTNEVVLFMLKNGVEINKTNEVFHISLFLGYSLGTIHSTQNGRMGVLRSIWLHMGVSWRWWNFCVNMVLILKSKISRFIFLWFIDLFFLMNLFFLIFSKYFRDKHQQTSPPINKWRSFLRFFFFFFSFFLKLAKNWNTIFWIGIHSHWWFN